MKITKEIATEMAKKMVSKEREIIKKERQDLYDEIEKTIYKTIPTEVLDFGFKEYLNKTNLVVLCSARSQWPIHHFYLKEELPSSRPSEIKYTLSPREEKLLQSLDKRDRELNNLKENISNTIYNLRTSSRVEKEFPEAIPFLPEGNGITTAICVQTDSIRKELSILNLP